MERERERERGGGRGGDKDHYEFFVKKANFRITIHVRVHAVVIRVHDFQVYITQGINS